MRPLGLKVAALLALVGALGVAIAGTATGASGVAALGWASLAAVGLGTMVRGSGLRVLGGLVLALALGSAVAAAMAGGWTWVAFAAALVLAVAGVAALREGGGWRRASATGPREAPKDLWKQFDAGDDPTDPR